VREFLRHAAHVFQGSTTIGSALFLRRNSASFLLSHFSEGDETAAFAALLHFTGERLFIREGVHVDVSAIALIVHAAGQRHALGMDTNGAATFDDPAFFASAFPAACGAH
jgi:hypothetical protein